METAAKEVLLNLLRNLRQTTEERRRWSRCRRDCWHPSSHWKQNPLHFWIATPRMMDGHGGCAMGRRVEQGCGTRCGWTAGLNRKARWQARLCIPPGEL